MHLTFGKRCTVGLALAAAFVALASVSPAIVADSHETGTTQIEKGFLTAPNRAGAGSGITRNLWWYLNAEAQGVDGWVFGVNEGVSTFELVPDPGALGTCDIDVIFFRADYSTAASFATAACAERGDVPSDAAYALVHLWHGFNARFEFRGS